MKWRLATTNMSIDKAQVPDVCMKRYLHDSRPRAPAEFQWVRLTVIRKDDKQWSFQCASGFKNEGLQLLSVSETDLPRLRLR